MRKARRLCLVAVLAGCGDVDPADVSSIDDAELDTLEEALVVPPALIDTSYDEVTEAVWIDARVPRAMFAAARKMGVEYDVNVTLDYLDPTGEERHAETSVPLSVLTRDYRLRARLYAPIYILLPLTHPPDPGAELAPVVEVIQRPIAYDRLNLINQDGTYYDTNFESMGILFNVPTDVYGQVVLGAFDVQLDISWVYPSGGVLTTVGTTKLLTDTDVDVFRLFPEPRNMWAEILTPGPAPDEGARIYSTYVVTRVP